MNIRTSETVVRERNLLPFPFDRDQVPREFEVTSLGSGFIISKDGYILTNNHVVSNVDKVTVKLNDGTEFEAEIVGTDPQTDIALLKIETDGNLQTIKIGDSNNLSVGEWVIAIGSPFGFEQTVTAGIISALNRRLPRENYVPFIQTDAAVNPGNSGGPLMNLKGEVIGINSQIFSRTGNFAGLSFAIPINIAIEIQRKLRQDGTIRRGYLGVYFGDVTPETAKAFGLEKPVGALVNQVIKDSPAEKAGLLPGDIILEFAGTVVENSLDFPSIVGGTSPNEKISIVIWRENRKMTVTVTIGETQQPGRINRRTLIGLELENMSSEELSQAGINGGIKITNFSPKQDSLPKGANVLRVNDIILSAKINQRDVKINNVSDLSDALKNNKSRFIALLIQRDEGRTFYVPLELR